MDNMAGADAGFSGHIQEQLRQAALTVSAPNTARGQSQSRRGRGHRMYIDHSYHFQPEPFYHNTSYYQQQPVPNGWGYQTMAHDSNHDPFPPLGTARPPIPGSNQTQLQCEPRQTLPSSFQPQPPQAHLQPQPQSQWSTHQHLSGPQQNARGESSRRVRGNWYRGRGRYAVHDNQNQQQQQHVQSQSAVYGANDFRRPAPAQRKLYTPGSQPRFNSVEEQRLFQRKIMDQSDFLNHLAKHALQNQISDEEQREKECFRSELENIAQKTVASMIPLESVTQLKPEHVQLKLYGSLGSGFAVTGSDMDLLLAFPPNAGPLGDIETDLRRKLEKSLLDVGIGARLLTNTRVPILRVCQKPGSELLRNLRQYRLKWEQSLTEDDLSRSRLDPAAKFGPLPILTDLQTAAAASALADLDLNACEVPLPASPTPDHAKLEYTGDCGIQCDINFSNYVALHNTNLLKAYGRCDVRVRQVGVFVKHWAKARNINTPYHGTLSSYGYILMVLHYLMNIVNPPIIPNLQELAKQRDAQQGKNDIELVEGFDVRFIRDQNEIQTLLGQMPRNHESVGSLLRGFFWYFADSRGFHWTGDVISIRSPGGGELTKRSKGWVGAKWASENTNVRLRYLLAIEDPFELNHNVARTVGHNGLVAIREEFRKMWMMIESIVFDNERKLWIGIGQNGQRVNGEEMLAVVENRGDLLRKDQNYHRQKMREMRLELEKKEAKNLQQQQHQQSEQPERPEQPEQSHAVAVNDAAGNNDATTPAVASIMSEQVHVQDDTQSRS